MHTVSEGCPKLAELRTRVGELELAEWHTRHSRNRGKRKGDVGVEKEKEKLEVEEREPLAYFFYSVYEFLTDATNFLFNSPLH